MLSTFKRSIKLAILIQIDPNEGKVSIVVDVVIPDTRQTIAALRTCIAMAVARKVTLEEHA